MAPRNNEKRNEILTAAYSLFSAQPYNDVSLTDISNNSGINKSLLQHYYSKKSDIVKALLDELLSSSYVYMDTLSTDYADLFQKISDYNMLFFKAASANSRLDCFVISSVSQHELLMLWIESICGWLRKLCGENTFTYLQLRTAIDFSMSGSMHLYQHKDELGIDYRFVCRNHIRSIMSLLQFSDEAITAICDATDLRCSDFSVKDYLEYCEKSVSWFTK